jgi:hypothetical protein
VVEGMFVRFQFVIEDESSFVVFDEQGTNRSNGRGMGALPEQQPTQPQPSPPNQIVLSPHSFQLRVSTL